VVVSPPTTTLRFTKPENVQTNIAFSKPSEIAKRAAIFTAVGQIGSLFAGIMMTAMHKTMEGKSGLKGWQWVFIIGKQATQLKRVRILK